MVTQCSLMGSLLCCKSFSTGTSTQDSPLLKTQQVTMVAYLEKVSPIKWGHLTGLQITAGQQTMSGQK